MTDTVDSDKLTSKRMERIIEAIRVYWNFLIPAFPDGRTPAEVAGVKARSWMQPLLMTCKERLDKLAVEIHPMDRYSEVMEQILDELERGPSTPRTVAITKIMEGLEKYGPVGTTATPAGEVPAAKLRIMVLAPVGVILESKLTKSSATI